ncbi:2TM domain-containing protein [uncultured Bacteroides sp.]|uniref:2TM domain-containing protein n=1 Tax=uncultured Bacteroides sp. TaxID=162156 RepID=UPI002AAC424E|nr:2TM domain-containing protein [uncultured Bacteroides sp.]
MKFTDGKKTTRFSLYATMSVVKYIVVNLFLFVVNWLTSPHYWWVLWIIAGWGIGLVLNLMSHYLEYRLTQE